MAQGVGYLIAAAGPLLAGSLHALTGRWTLSLVVLTALLLPQVIAGAAASKPRFAGG
jgi:CP family cyanate transporter-like MFS transporter